MESSLCQIGHLSAQARNGILVLQMGLFSKACLWRLKVDVT
jgi:hypothetical protein